MRLDNLETHQKKIFEGLRPGDLENLVLPEVTIDDFEPKSGSPENIVVVSFYVKEGFEVLATLPDWYQYLLYIAISASFGIKGVGQAAKMLRKK